MRFDRLAGKFSIAVILLFVSSFVYGNTSPVGSPAEVNGVLHVHGTNLCNQYGMPIQLRGVSTHGLQWFPTCYTNGKSINALAQSWHGDVLRAVMYIEEQGYLTNPASFRKMIDNIVDTCKAAGIYCIIDWHVHWPGNPMADIDSAVSFWTYMSNKHKADPVLYEICNEPSNADANGNAGTYTNWSTIKTYADSIIHVIRRNDTNTVVLVGTPSWSTLGLSTNSNGSDMHDIENNKLIDKNAMYVFHFYANHHYFSDSINAVASRLPLFCTEWAASSYTTDSQNDSAAAQVWINIMAKHKIGWCYFDFSDGANDIMSMFKSGTCPSGSYAVDGGNLTSTGKLVNYWMNNPPDSFPVPVTQCLARNDKNNSNVALSMKGKEISLVYANPSRAFGTISLYSALGVKVFESRAILGAGMHTVKINARSLRSGVYVLRLVIGETAVTRNFVLP